MSFKKIIVVLLVGVVFISGVGIWKLNRMNAFIWLGDYLLNSPSFSEIEGVVDIVFVVPDHWEPGGRIGIVNQWMTGYRRLADKHIDYDGVRLQHTWYYPIDQFRGWELDSIVRLSAEGYGDVELHLHHRDDTSESLRKKFTVGLDSLRAHGALVSADGASHFSFVHGNWALDNSRLEEGRNYCGVNDEISILLELGCYSDLTFPSLSQTSQPSLVNKIYYAVDDPELHKSYDKGTRSIVGHETRSEELMIFEGPLVIDWFDWRFKTHPTIEDGNLYYEIPTTLHRFEIWLKANIHVQGRPNWVFVRPFTHGADLRHPDAYDNILGENIDQMLTEVEAKYNDGEKYRLHYMTAREAYNVVKAAEAGLDGNPHAYRDHILKPYQYPDLTEPEEGS